MRVSTWAGIPSGTVQVMGTVNPNGPQAPRIQQPYLE